MNDSRPIRLSTSESRIVLQALSVSIEHENKALEACRRERPSQDLQQSIKARQEQITKFELLRRKIGKQL